MVSVVTSGQYAEVTEGNRINLGEERGAGPNVSGRLFF